MNPAKRKKLLRLKLSQQKQEVTVVEPKVEKVISVVQETASVPVSELEMGLKLTDESVDFKKEKDKKKKTTTQEP
jgi:hypothetical protein